MITIIPSAIKKDFGNLGREIYIFIYIVYVIFFLTCQLFTGSNGTLLDLQTLYLIFEHISVTVNSDLLYDMRRCDFSKKGFLFNHSRVNIKNTCIYL